MNLKDALAKVDDLLPALEKLLAPDAMLAFRTVYDAAHGSAVADVLREVSRTVAGDGRRVCERHDRGGFCDTCQQWACLNCRDIVPPGKGPRCTACLADAVTVPHLFLGGSGKPCALCDKPRHHDIHPNRGTP